MHLLHHRFELVTLVDNGTQPFRLLGEVWACMRFDADRVLGEQLLLRGFELTLAAKLGKTVGDLLRIHDSAPLVVG